MNPLARVGLAARRGFGKVVPDPFVIAIGLTVFVLGASVVAGHSVVETLNFWNRGAGLWSLLTFAMQIGLMLILGGALAAAPDVRRVLTRLAGLARGPRQLVGLCALVAIGLGLVNWSLSLVGGALLARAAGAEAARRRWKLHYPLLCAASYAGLMVWHGGFSGSAPLKATTMPDMVDVLGSELAARVGTIPLQESILGPLNRWVSGGLLLLGPLVFMAMTPADGADPDPRPAPPQKPQPPPDRDPTADGAESGGGVERSWITTLALAAPLAAALGVYLAERGIGRIDLNTVNLTLWLLALGAHRRPHRFVAACEDAVKSTTGVFLQFPLYAGIMGVMAGAGLSVRLSQLFAEVGPTALVVVTFFSAGALNLLVPSGGGQWAVQGPIILDAALRLGIAPADVMMALAYGDQWTNMLQPFWALPLLAITGVRARDIVGYAAVWMVVGGVWIMGNLLVHAASGAAG